jgi:hypothetical protein
MKINEVNQNLMSHHNRLDKVGLDNFEPKFSRKACRNSVYSGMDYAC